MVKGHPDSYQNADPLLDELVRQTFLFRSTHDLPLPARQPERYEVLRDARGYQELTDALIGAGCISEGYVAVLNGVETGVKDAFEEGRYRLVVYTINGKQSWERKGGVNADIVITLKRGTASGIQHAVGLYVVSGDKAVIFEEPGFTVEGWVGLPRKIEITPKADLNCPPDFYLFGAAPEGKSLLDGNGTPVRDYFFPQHQPTLDGLPAGTVFRMDPHNDRAVWAYTPHLPK